MEIVKVESVILSLPPNTPVLSNIATSLTVSNARLPVTMTTSKPLSELPATCGGQESAKVCCLAVVLLTALYLYVPGMYQVPSLDSVFLLYLHTKL